MDVKIFPAGKALGGTVRIVPSKSQAHRALICAAFADRPTRIICGSVSEDIEATAACLTALGAGITRTLDGYNVRPRDGADAGDTCTLPCGESGSTFRFLLPVACALGRKASFIPRGRLPERPLSPLYEELVRHGCALSPQGAVPFLTEGQLTPGSYTLDAGISSQFISGLLFALPLLDGDSELRLTGQAESFSYVALTLAMIEAFGISVAFDGTVFKIPGGQTYRSPETIHVEGDWSNAAFWLCAGAVGAGRIACAGLDPQSGQGDRAALDILSGFGAKIEAADSAVAAYGGNLRGIEIDAGDIPDLVPILSVVGAAASGVTIIKNAGRLRLKESDRLAAITSTLNSLGADISETTDGLVIRGGKTLSGGVVSSWGDHRIAMAAAIAALICTEPVLIKGADAVSKSYPNFFDDLTALGGSVELLNA